MAKHNNLGKKGEEIACDFLIREGFRIVERNWRHGKDEIDIIAMDEDFLVIVEVKTRSTDFFGLPEEAVTNKKQKYLIRAADAYINIQDLHWEVRYDIIAIILEGNKQIINHIKDAFYPTL